MPLKRDVCQEEQLSGVNYLGRLTNLRRQSRLGGMKLLGCPREVTDLGDPPEIEEVMKIKLF